MLEDSRAGFEEDKLRQVPREFVRSPETMARTWTPAESLAYTRWLARHHYENFHVASFLLPRRLHQDFFNVYAFCRWADDLSDEIGDTQESLRLLGWWRDEQKALYRGRTRHPVFVARAETARRHELPPEPFDDLIRAFEQDQRVTRYRDQERQKLSDATCTALQLANFWQDVAADVEKGRIYLPLDLLAKHGCCVEDVEARRLTPAFREAMKEAAGVARRLFEEGLPLVRLVGRRLAIDLELFSRGGMKILDKIKAQDYDVLRRRPAISKTERAGLLLRTLARRVWH